MPRTEFTIAPARGARDIADVRALLAAYGESIKHVALLVGFADELAALPGRYVPPKGELLIARGSDGAALGCIALHPLPDGAGEIKRLYVAPEARRMGLGRALMDAIVAAARAIGYTDVKLDTLPILTEALALYRAMGFVEIERYNDNPNPVLVFMKLAL